MNLEQLLRLSIAQVEAKKAAKPTRDERLARDAEWLAYDAGLKALMTRGKFGRYLKRHALRKLEVLAK
jgi:hypothetical protein